MRWARLTFWAWLAASGCDDAPARPDSAKRRAYRLAAEELRDPIAQMAGYATFLSEPAKTSSELPARHLQAAASSAQSRIHLAAIDAQSRAKLSLSPVTAALEPAFAEVAQRCPIRSSGEGWKAFTACRGALEALDKALQAASASSAEDGVRVVLPHLKGEALTGAAREDIARLNAAIAAGPKESAYLKRHQNPDASLEELTLGCKAASEEVESMSSGKAPADEHGSLRRIHALSVQRHCTALALAVSAVRVLRTCQGDSSEACQKACVQAQSALIQQLPAAARKHTRDALERACAPPDKPPASSASPASSAPR